MLGGYGVGVLRDTLAPTLAWESFFGMFLMGGLLTVASAGAGVWLALRLIGRETPMRKAVVFALTALVVVPLTASWDPGSFHSPWICSWDSFSRPSSEA